MEGGGGGKDDRCEYVTLHCRRSATGGGDETKMHVKVWFYDDRTATDCGDGQTTVLRVQGVTVGSGDASSVYEGRVTGRQVAEVKGATTGGDHVRRWLEYARHAFVGPRDGGDDAVEYLHCLERVPSADGGHDQVLTWKQKLRPFGAVTRGSVRLCRATGTDGVPDQVCSLFVEPLFDRLRAERLRGERAERAAAEDSLRLLADNRRLLDELRSAADCRRLDDARLMARFAEVLNAKKTRLAKVQQELSELIEQRRRDDDVPAVVQPEKAGVSLARRRGASKSAGRRGGKRGTTAVDSASTKRGREQTTTDGQERPYGNHKDRLTTAECSIRPSWHENMDTVKETQHVADNQQQEIMETDKCSSAVIIADPVSVHNNMNVVDFDVFEADTQIDDDPSSSPSFFQQVPSTPLNEADALPLNKNLGHHQNKSFLDDLWQGIL